jgi:predicted NBD/HSP70 family sugar kinase
MAKSDPQSRRQTRGFILEQLLRRKGAFRPELAAGTSLSDVSVWRIVSELRHEGLVTESRRRAPYVGGPSSFFTLSTHHCVVGVELSNGRLSVGIGQLDGALLQAWRREIPADLGQDQLEAMCGRLLHEALAEARRRSLVPVQAAIALPGYGGAAHRRNRIFPWDLPRLRAFLNGFAPPLPFEITNSVIAQAAYDRYVSGAGPAVERDHLFVFVGHGVAAAIVSAAGALDAFAPVEMGHTIVQRGGARCRCGHDGCLEAYTSLQAVAGIVGQEEASVLELGDAWLEGRELGPRVQAQLRDRLTLLGLGIGNALNLHGLRSVVVAGWPSLLGPEERAAVAHGIDESFFGGLMDDVSLDFRRPGTGGDPAASVAFAAWAFARRGGIDSPEAAALAA